MNKFIVITLSIFIMIVSIIILILSLYQFYTFTKTIGVVKCKNNKCYLKFDKYLVQTDLESNTYYNVFYKKDKEGNLKKYYIDYASFAPNFIGTLSYIVFFSIFTFLTILNLYITIKFKSI
jgi:hypothetical protein